MSGTDSSPQQGHTHGHSHGSGADVDLRSERVRRAVVSAVLACVVITGAGLIAIWPGDTADVVANPSLDVELVTATVRGAESVPCAGVENLEPDGCVDVEIDVTSGETNGDSATFQLAGGPNTVDLSPGDRIIVSYNPDSPPELQYLFADFDRDRPLILLAVLFVISVLALGLFQGFRALVGAVVSLIVLIYVLLPALLEGTSPMPVALVAASAIALLALFLTHGVNHRTAVAYLGTVASLVLTAGLGGAFVAVSRFSGLADEEAVFLQISADQIDLTGLLLAGIVIGTLGVLDDVTVTQVSAVWELAAADPDRSARSLYSSALTIGRDHIASTVNTLVLAYAGAALPLLLLFTQSSQSFGQILNGEVVAVEVVRALVGSIGLVASVPITTGLAVAVVGRGVATRPEPSDGPQQSTDPVAEPDTGPEPPEDADPDWTDFSPTDDEDDFWSR